MPVNRYDLADSARWGTRRLNHEAHILHGSTNNMILDNLGKISRRVPVVKFPNNNGKELQDAICSAREGSRGAGAGAATAMARAAQPEVKEYLGRVKSLEGDNVIAEIGPPDDMDRWDVIIPLAAFSEQPKTGEEI